VDEETAEALMTFIPAAPPLRSTTSQQQKSTSTTTTATGATAKPAKSIFSSNMSSYEEMNQSRNKQIFSKTQTGPWNHPATPINIKDLSPQRQQSPP
jgi:hypothetical protein